MMSQLTHYHIACLNALASRDVRVETIELWRTARHPYDDAKYADARFHVSTLFGERSQASVRAALPRLIRTLRASEATHVLIPGWGNWHALALAGLSVARRSRLMVLSDTCHLSAGTSRGRMTLKRAVLPSLFPDAFVSGRLAKQYLEALGFDPRRIRVGYYSTDVQHIERAIRHVRLSNAMVPDKVPSGGSLLYAGLLTHRKNVMGLLRAYERYRGASRHPRDLVLAGDGDLASEIPKCGVQGVRLTGWCSPAELVREMAGASLFILPSFRDAWGVVVLEACAAGLPVIVSSRCGSAYDLVTPENGWTFAPEDEDSLMHLMLDADDLDTEDLTRMGTKSQEIAARFDSRVWAATVHKWMEETAA